MKILIPDRAKIIENVVKKIAQLKAQPVGFIGFQFLNCGRWVYRKKLWSAVLKNRLTFSIFSPNLELTIPLLINIKLMSIF
jgi:hypothetical protein